MRSSNAAVVLQTLVPQAREIFKLLAHAQPSEQAEEDGSEGPAPFQKRHTHNVSGVMAWVQRRKGHSSLVLTGNSSV